MYFMPDKISSLLFCPCQLFQNRGRIHKYKKHGILYDTASRAEFIKTVFMIRVRNPVFSLSDFDH